MIVAAGTAIVLVIIAAIMGVALPEIASALPEIASPA